MDRAERERSRDVAGIRERRTGCGCISSPRDWIRVHRLSRSSRGSPPELPTARPSTSTLDFNPTDFIQVNGAMNAALVSRAIELLRPEPGGRVLDLYCGLGNFTLALARAVGPGGQVVGVEGDRELVRRGGENAAPERHFRTPNSTWPT